MQLELKPHKDNLFTAGGLLLQSTSVETWLEALQILEADLTKCRVYAIPGEQANSLWGCFVDMPAALIEKKVLNNWAVCQRVFDHLFIPAYSCIYPMISPEEAGQLLGDVPHIFHPAFGLYALDTPVDWATILQLPVPNNTIFRQPQRAVFIPETLLRLEIQAPEPEAALQEMENKVFPAKEIFPDKPLNLLEKIKLGLLRTLFKPGPARGDGGGREPGRFFQWLSKLRVPLVPGGSRLLERMEQDLEQLEKRNQSELDKLMDLFKKNPGEALKYAMPLDDGGTGRGGISGGFEMMRRWNSFNLFGNNSGSGSGNTYLGDDSYSRLYKQYTKTAEDLIEEGEHQKAAFVYMKLMKDNRKGAAALEKGKFYGEAAAVYLRYLHDKNKAAECYEHGQMTTEAIKLYKEVKNYEKVGDLYIGQQKTAEANEFYQLLVDEHLAAGKYVPAASVYSHKMLDVKAGQELLLKGWRLQRDPFNCLNHYFKNIADPLELKQSINAIYEKDVTDNNKATFLRALKQELGKDAIVKERSTEIAYEIIASTAASDKTIISELRHFNSDPLLVKDVLRFKTAK